MFVVEGLNSNCINSCVTIGKLRTATTIKGVGISVNHQLAVFLEWDASIYVLHVTMIDISCCMTDEIL